MKLMVGRVKQPKQSNRKEIKKLESALSTILRMIMQADSEEIEIKHGASEREKREIAVEREK